MPGCSYGWVYDTWATRYVVMLSGNYLELFRVAGRAPEIEHLDIVLARLKARRYPRPETVLPRLRVGQATVKQVCSDVADDTRTGWKAAGEPASTDAPASIGKRSAAPKISISVSG